jgi:ElaB/YqjD/DUF883 family membrane-anchored ribosome-binding protein
MTITLNQHDAIQHDTKEGTMEPRTNSRDQEIGINDLKNDIHQLRDDLSRVANAVLDNPSGQKQSALTRESHATLERLRERVDNLQERARERVDDLQERARETGSRAVKGVEHRIEEHPFTSLLTIFCIGMLLGRLFKR